MAFFYCAFGLYLSCNQPIPGLVALPANLRKDVQVYLGFLPPWLEQFPEEKQQVWSVSQYKDEHDQPILKIWLLADGAYFRLLYHDRTEFIIDRKGSEVWAIWSDSSSLEDTATYLLGPILGSILRLRNVVCLHASAVAVEDKCFAIAGASGAGKSTTAAAFAEAGLPILSDDIVSLWEQEKGFLVQPAYPRLRLWSSSVQTLYGKSDALPCLTPNWDKRYLDLTQEGYKFQQQALPLGAIYILNDRTNNPIAPFINAVPAHQSLIKLLANTYATSFLDKQLRAQEFDVLGRVTANLPIKLVTPHADSKFLRKLCDLIWEDFQTIAH